MKLAAISKVRLEVITVGKVEVIFELISEVKLEWILDEE